MVVLRLIKSFFTNGNKRGKKRDRTITEYRAQVKKSGGNVDQCYLWDISAHGVGLLAEQSKFGIGDQVEVVFPIGKDKQIVRTAVVKTIKIYHPKPAINAFNMLRCSAKFDKPLESDELSQISLESYRTQKAG